MSVIIIASRIRRSFCVKIPSSFAELLDIVAKELGSNGLFEGKRNFALCLKIKSGLSSLFDDTEISLIRPNDVLVVVYKNPAIDDLSLFRLHIELYLEVEEFQRRKFLRSQIFNGVASSAS